MRALAIVSLLALGSVGLAGCHLSHERVAEEGPDAPIGATDVAIRPDVPDRLDAPDTPDAPPLDAPGTDAPDDGGCLVGPTGPTPPGTPRASRRVRWWMPCGARTSPRARSRS